MYARLHFTNGIDCARSSVHHSFTVIASNSHLEWSQPSIWLHMKCANTKLSAATSSEWIQSNYKFMLAKNYYNIAAFVRHSLPVYRIKLAISAIWQWLSVYLSKLVRRRTINGVNFVAFKCERTVHALSPLPKILNGQWAIECGVCEICSRFVFHLALS